MIVLLFARLVEIGSGRTPLPVRRSKRAAETKTENFAAESVVEDAVMTDPAADDKSPEPVPDDKDSEVAPRPRNRTTPNSGIRAQHIRCERVVAPRFRSE
jgi:hypothetical protein